MLDEIKMHVPDDRSAAVLDNAHIGDIYGAFGTIAQQAAAPRRWTRKWLLMLLVVMGPGLITMVGDNDAGGIATYTAAGQNYGTSLLWTLLLLIPVLIVNQEMVVRLGAVTGVGHARLIFQRFGTFWGAFSVGDLFLLNFLTIVTEFIGFSLALRYFGISPYLSVPVGVLFLIGITVTGSFRRWEQWMYVCVAVSLLMIPLAFLPHHLQLGPIVHDTFIPGLKGGVTATALLLIIGIVGTTVAPWQLFFQQSNVVDKRITPRWIGFERTDTTIGAVIACLNAGGLMVAAAFAFGGTTFFGAFQDAGTTAFAYRATLGSVGASIFAIILLNASIIGACAVTLSTSYAFGDVFRVKHSLHRSWKDAKLFYGSYSLLIVFAGVIVLLPNAPLGLITTGVQALAGILLPSASVFLLLLCNDRAVLGPWVNKPWLNAVASAIIGLLVMLSFILAAVTLFPTVDVPRLTLLLLIMLVISLAVIGLFQTAQRRRKRAASAEPSLAVGADGTSGAPLDRMMWRMPPLERLPKPVLSLSRRVGLLTLRGYLVVAVLLLLVKIVQLALGH